MGDSHGSSGQEEEEQEDKDYRRSCKLITVKKRDSGTHLFGQQGDEVSLKLRLDHLHHMLDLCGLTAVNQLIQRQQLLWASPALENEGQRL